VVVGSGVDGVVGSLMASMMQSILMRPFSVTYESAVEPARAKEPPSSPVETAGRS
jgi:hypothetical protein